jgi:hypothetical protein
MRNPERLLLLTLSTFFLLMLSTASLAEQKGTQGPAAAKKAVLVQPLSVSLAAKQTFCEEMVATINEVIQTAHHDLKATIEQYSPKPEVNYIVWPEIWDLYYTSPPYRIQVEACCSPKKSFSVQEQQQAGCSGNDTVNSCIDKLIKKCVKSTPKIDQLKTDLNHSQKKALEISHRTMWLYQKLEKLTNMMK